ncbi:uncharacterized protein LOC144146134 [Haemaphysalis longicornis]
MPEQPRGRYNPVPTGPADHSPMPYSPPADVVTVTCTRLANIALRTLTRLATHAIGTAILLVDVVHWGPRRIRTTQQLSARRKGGGSGGRGGDAIDKGLVQTESGSLAAISG